MKKLLLLILLSPFAFSDDTKNIVHYGASDPDDRLLGVGRYENGTWVEYITFRATSTHGGAGVGQPSMKLNNSFFL